MSFATSYIKTENWQVTRASENVSVDALSGWLNSEEGTFLYTGHALSSSEDADYKIFFLLSSAEYNFQLLLGRRVNTDLFIQWRDGVGTHSTRTIPSVDVTSPGPMAVSYKQGKLLISANGQIVADEFYHVNQFTDLLLGTYSVKTNTQHCKGLKYIPRALSATELEALTS